MFVTHRGLACCTDLLAGRLRQGSKPAVLCTVPKPEVAENTSVTRVQTSGGQAGSLLGRSGRDWFKAVLRATPPLPLYGEEVMQSRLTLTLACLCWTERHKLPVFMIVYQCG
ncbi:hypothetical protein E2C01_067208 [Portunus trituberculatus]|uniref:Uncharacterized protein n=1 Tax=Portunus trituberculatus TaxID=210409 RepID=A0A5B7HT13_PORTR|nr:hypothetical protein [Portunus trituberculatus]